MSCFRLAYNEMQSWQTARTDMCKPVSEIDGKQYETPGYGRALIMVWPDGRKRFLSYGYLTGGDLDLKNQLNVITLEFLYHTVTLKGYNLGSLFLSLLDQLQREVIQVDKRYLCELTNNDYPTVIEMDVKEKP